MNETLVQKANPIAVIYDNEKDIRLSIQLNRWTLKPIGIWPKSANTSFIGKCVNILINIICAGLIGFLFIPCVIYLGFEAKDTYYTLRFSGPLSFYVMAIIKYTALILHKNNIRKGIEHIKNDWINTKYLEDRIIMTRNAKFGRRFGAICAISMYGGALFYYVYVPLSNGKVTENDGNLTYQPLILPVARMIVDTRYSPVSEIFFCVQTLAGIIVHSVTAGASSIAAVFAMHAYSRMEILMQWIEHLVDGREDFRDNLDKRVSMIVQHHVRILNFISLMSKILREISVVEILGCTVNMVFLGYNTIMVCISCKEWHSKDHARYITYIILLMSFTFNIFIFCYIGELVNEQFKKIGEVSYMIDWYRLPEKKSLALMLMIIMSNSSVKFTAGNLFELSLTTFGDVVKAAVGYINMLRTLTST